ERGLIDDLREVALHRSTRGPLAVTAEGRVLAEGRAAPEDVPDGGRAPIDRTALHGRPPEDWHPLRVQLLGDGERTVAPDGHREHASDHARLLVVEDELAVNTGDPARRPAGDNLARCGVLLLADPRRATAGTLGGRLAVASRQFDDGEHQGHRVDG